MFAKAAPLALFSVLLATAGQLLLKAGMENVGYIDGARLKKPIALALAVLRTPQVVGGLALFVISAASWLMVLSRVPLSIAYPFVGLTYVLTALFSQFVLKEEVPIARWLGILLILAGILVVGQTSPAQVPHPGHASAATPNQEVAQE